MAKRCASANRRHPAISGCAIYPGANTEGVRHAVSGRHRGSGGLAKSSLGWLRKVLHAALQRAVERELVGRKPMEPLRRRLPNGRAPEAKVMDAAGAAALIARIDHPIFAPAVWLA